MKLKALLAAILLAATNFAWATGGGLGIDNVEQHMGSNEYTSVNNSRPENIVQGSIDKFQVVMPEREQTLADTDIEDYLYGDLDVLS